MPNHKNSLSKIESCQRKLQKAIDLIAFEMKQTPSLESVHIVLTGYLPRLDPAVAEKANLDEVFVAAEIEALKAKIAEVKKAARRAKSEADLINTYERASAQLARWSVSMDPELAASLNERMAAVALDCTEPEKVADLQPLFRLCKEVFQATGDVQNAKVEGLVRKSWTVTKDGQPAKYAVPFADTTAALKVAAWLVNKPAANADHREFKAWRDAGYELLKGALEAPWGFFQCKGHGETPVKVMPIQPRGGGKWFIPSECHTCHTAGQTSTGKKGKGSREWEPAPQPVGMDFTGWKPEDVRAFQEKTEESREEARRSLKAQQKAKKLAAKQTRREEREDHESVEIEIASLSAKDKAENEKIAAQAMARSASFKVLAPAKKVTEAKRDGKKKKSQETEATPKKGKKK